MSKKLNFVTSKMEDYCRDETFPTIKYPIIIMAIKAPNKYLTLNNWTWSYANDTIKYLLNAYTMKGLLKLYAGAGDKN